MALTRNKPLSDAGILLQGITGLAIAVLVMLGVGGSIYYVAVAGSTSSIVALLIIGLGAWLFSRSSNRRPELFVYGFAAVGAVYAFQFFTHGGL
jgi:ABC-type nickel/cobalt efflux system permease component RcnA